MTFQPDTTINEAFASTVQHFHSWLQHTFATLFTKSLHHWQFLWLVGPHMPTWSCWAIERRSGIKMTEWVGACAITPHGLKSFAKMRSNTDVYFPHSTGNICKSEQSEHETESLLILSDKRTCSNEYRKNHSLRGVTPVFAIFSKTENCAKSITQDRLEIASPVKPMLGT